MTTIIWFSLFISAYIKSNSLCVYLVEAKKGEILIDLCLFLLRTKSVSALADHSFADPGLASIQSRRLTICASEIAVDLKTRS